MKAKDIIDIKNIFAGLPHTVLAWALTFTTLLTVGLLYVGARHAWHAWAEKQQQSAVNDSILMHTSRQIVWQVNKLNTKVDSLGYCLKSQMVITNEKINIVAREVEKINHNNSSITDEYRKLDSLYRLLYSPFIFNYEQQKKTSPTALN